MDDARHFQTIIPQLAMEHPIILNGILALASRWDGLTRGSPLELESTYYHNRCIGLLIDSLSKPPETYDTTLLAAMVISRLYEENDIESDTMTCHLSGTRTLLSHEVVHRLAKEGGFAEAVYWVHLRQAIYVAIVNRSHLDIPLGIYESLTSFWKTDATSYANQIVFVFAQILQEFFPDNPKGATPRSDIGWDVLEDKLETWFDGKPPLFEPMYQEPADPDSSRPFPSLWMISMVPSESGDTLGIDLSLICYSGCFAALLFWQDHFLPEEM